MVIFPCSEKQDGANGFVRKVGIEPTIYRASVFFCLKHSVVFCLRVPEFLFELHHSYFFLHVICFDRL